MSDNILVSQTKMGDPVVKLTLPIDLYQDLMCECEKANRTLSEEVILRLIKSFNDDDSAMLSKRQLMRLIYSR